MSDANMFHEILAHYIASNRRKKRCACDRCDAVRTIRRRHAPWWRE